MSDDLLRKALRYRMYIFWILALGYVLVYFHRLCPAVVALDMMKDLGTGGTLLGILGSAYFYPYAIMQLPAGLLSDSWGPRRTITLFFSIAFVGSLLQGLAPGLTAAIAGRVLVGLGVSMLFVPTMKILAEWFEVREFSSMTGILMAMGGLGSLIAATPLALLSNWVGWRTSFVIIAVFTLFLAILVYLVVRDRPAEMGLPAPGGAPGTRPAQIDLLEGMKKVLGSPRFYPLAIWFFFDCAIFFSFGGLWGGPYMMQIYGLSKAEAGQILSMLAIGMIAGSPAVGYLSTHILKGRKPVLILASGITLVVTAPLAFMTASLPIPLLYVICFLMGFFTSAIVVIGFTAAKELFPVQMAGTSTGLANLFPFAGGAVMQPVLGHILESHGKVGNAFVLAGYESAFFVLFLCAVAALLASFCIKETFHAAR